LEYGSLIIPIMEFPRMSLKKQEPKPHDVQPPYTGEDPDKNKDNAGESPGHAEEKASHREKDLHALIRSRKENEKQLFTRYSLLQAIVEGADSAIFSVDTRYCYTSFNRKHAKDVREIYGTEIITGGNLSGVFHIEKDNRKIRHLIGQALAGDAVTDGDYFGDNARSRRYFGISGYPLRDETGTITGAAMILRDMTGQKKTEKELRERGDQFYLLAENSPDLVYCLSVPEGTFEYINPASVRLTGYSPEEFYNNAGLMQDLVHPLWRSSFREQQELMIRGKNPPENEFQIVHRDGDVRWVHQRNTPIRDKAGHIIGIEALVTDITEAKNTEDALRESEIRFRSIFESAGIGILLVNEQTHCIADANSKFLDLIGASRQEILGSMHHRFTGPGETGKGLVSNIGDRRDASESVLQTCDGRSLPVLKTVVSAVLSGKHMLIESFVDITEQKRTWDMLQESEERHQTFFANSSEGIFRYEAGCTIPVTLPADEQIALLREHGYIAECNDAMARMCGWTRAEELEGKKIGEVMDCDDPRTTDCMRMFIRHGYRIAEYESEGRAKTGDIHWFSSTLWGVVRDGSVVRLWGVRREITDRQLMVAALRESEERYNALFASSRECVYIIDLSGGFIDANRATLDLLGYRKEELLALSFTSLLDPGQRERARNEITEIVATGSRTNVSEYTLLHKDGHTIEVESSCSVICHDGKPVAIQGIARDITERRRSWAAVRESEKRFRELVEHSPDFIYTIDFSGTLTSASPAVLTFLGYMADEILGKNISEFLTSESVRYIRNDIDQKRGGQRTEAHYTIEFVSKDGHIVPFEVNSRARSDGAGRQDIIAIAREISERKKTEDALLEREERFRTLLRSMPSVAVQGYLPDHTVVCWNETSARMYGYSEEEAMGRDIRELFVPWEIREKITAASARMAESGIPEPAAEMVLVNRDGNPVPVFSSYTVIKIPGRSTVIFSIEIDLTTRQRAEDAERKEKEHLQSILDSAPFGTLEFKLHDDGSLVVVSSNRAAGSILGTDCSRYIGMTIENAFPALATTEIPDTLRGVARNGEPFHLDSLEYADVGTPSILEIHAMRAGQGRIAVFFRDVSGKKKAEDELARSEAKYRSIVGNTSDILQILDTEKRLVYSSPAFSELLGYPEGYQNSRDALGLVHPEDRARVLVDLEEVYTRTNPGIPTEYRVLKAGGDYIYVESVGVNLIGVPGIDGIVITTHVVHERKLSEQVMQESEERFRFIFRHSHDAIYLSAITPSGMFGTIVDANDSATLQTGYSGDELHQKTLVEISSRELAQKSHMIMMELFTRGEARFETGLYRNDGSLMPVEISARLAKLRDKTYIVAISRDVSRRQHDERALQIANQKLQLMNIVAWNEIQNKVAGLRGSVELGREPVTEEKRKKIIDSVDEVLNVIHRQLQYTKEYRELGIHSPQWVNLPQILRMIVSSKGFGPVKFIMDLRDLELYCDPIIDKVFSHLIDNTQKHGKKATEIHITCSEATDCLRIIYEDDGVGIPPEKKKDLFIQGTVTSAGLSLFFVHDILEISDMTIRETGEPGKGARFEIYVPRGLYRTSRNVT
jgi:PAS domain S-box-containing protein